jgi:hypothetical protein
MKVFGSLSRLVNLIFRKDNNDVTVRPNQATTYTASRDIQLPAGDAAHVLVSTTSSDTLTGKTIDGDDNTVQDLALSTLKTVVGSANNVVRRDNTGAVVSSGPVTISDAGAVAGATQLSVDNVDINGNTISSTNTDGNIVLDPNGTGIIDAQAQITATGALKSATSLILEETGAGTDTITIAAPASIAASYSLTLPVDDGAAGEVLSTDGSGVLSWVSNASSSSFAATWLAATGTSKTVTHNLGSTDVLVQIFDIADGKSIMVDSIARTDTNTVDLVSSEAPGVSWRVLVLKL